MSWYQGAIWDPEGRMILLAFSDSSVLGSIHFASKPPSLGIWIAFTVFVPMSCYEVDLCTLSCVLQLQ